jgi:hypothetical protein
MAHESLRKIENSNSSLNAFQVGLDFNYSKLIRPQLAALPSTLGGFNQPQPPTLGVLFKLSLTHSKQNV